jgi:hypothetical protein
VTAAFGVPVPAIDACIYWRALRVSGVPGRVGAWGSLLERH